MKAGQIYFIECAGRIKVGFSTDVQNRLRRFSTGSAFKFSLLGTINGTRALERAVHQRLAGHRLHGEWFEDCNDVRQIMDGLLTAGSSFIGFMEPTVRRVVADEPTPALWRPEPSVMHPIIVRMEACAERYLGPGSPYCLADRVARASAGFLLVHNAVNSVEKLIGLHRELEQSLPVAAAIVSRLELDFESLFRSASRELN